MIHAMTCDVEDYFQVSAFDGLIPKVDWNDTECRIPANIDKALQIFADTGVKATFFTLGSVAERYPAVVRQIADNGHEVASQPGCDFAVMPAILLALVGPGKPIHRREFGELGIDHLGRQAVSLGVAPRADTPDIQERETFEAHGRLDPPGKVFLIG